MKRKVVFAALLASTIAGCTTSGDGSKGDVGVLFRGPEIGYSDYNLVPKPIDPIKLPEVGQVDYTAQQEMQELTTKRLFDSLEGMCSKIEVSSVACKGIKVNVRQNELPNAFAWGLSNITISSSVLKMVENEHEMAMLISHDMGHLLADHVDENATKRQSEVMGAAIILGVTLCGASCAGQIAANSNNGSTAIGFLSEEGGNHFDDFQEREANYLSVYLMERAGFDVVKGMKIFRKLRKFTEPASLKSKSEATYMDTHGAPETQFARIFLTMKEVRKKRKQNQPLLPNGS